MGFQVHNTEVGLAVAKGSKQEEGEVDHQEGQVDGIGDGGGGGIHEILQAPELFGVSEIKFNLEARAVIVDELVEGQGEVGAEQDHMGDAAILEVGFDDKDDIERVSEVVMEGLKLIDVGANPALATTALEAERFFRTLRERLCQGERARCSTRLRSKWNLARPSNWRLRNLSRLTCPSV